MPAALRSPAAVVRFGLTAAIGVGLDLWAKAFSVEKLTWHGRPYPFIPGLLEFELQRNQGAVFGLGQGQRILFLFASMGAIVFLTYLFATSGTRRTYQIFLGMLMAGIIGNLYDRVEYGYVRDMIHALPRWRHLYPYIFNVADSFLCVGVGLMIVHSFLSTQKTPQAKSAP